MPGGNVSRRSATPGSQTLVLPDRPPAPERASVAGPVRRWTGWLNRRRLAVGLLVLLGLVHVLAVAPAYHFGSFDDDASYLEMAKGLTAGLGFTSRLPQGSPLAATYPPGFPALLAPLALVSGHAVWPYRALSTVLFGVVLLLTWTYLGRRGVGDRARYVVLAVLALNPVAATFATMVMAEMPYLVVLLLLLILADRWSGRAGVVSWRGVGVVACAAGLIWLKEAGLAFAGGVVLWYLLRRDWRRAGFLAVGTGLLVLPIALARLLEHTPLAGTRYSDELGGYYAGGLVDRFVHVLPNAIGKFVGRAVPRSIAPVQFIHGSVQSGLGPLLGLITVTTMPLVIVGFVIWLRRHRDCAVVAVPVYLLEALSFPSVNERRVILILPLIVAWYVLGAAWLVRLIVASSRRLAPALRRPVALGLPCLGALLVAGVLVAQFPRDYLYSFGVQSSRPDGSAYMSLLTRAAGPGQIIETDYLWTTSLFTGHQTRNSAFVAGCAPAGQLLGAVRADRAAFALSAALNPRGLGNRCLLQALSADPHAVLLYASPVDNASVFELVGPGSPQPSLSDGIAPGSPVVSGPGTVSVVPGVAQTPGQRVPATYAVRLSGSAPVALRWQVRPSGGGARQASVGPVTVVGGGSGELRSAVLQVREGSRWVAVAGSTGPVGFLLSHLSGQSPVSAVRLLLIGRGTVELADVHVLVAR